MTPKPKAAKATTKAKATTGFRAEVGRKAIHLSFLIVPVTLVHPWLPWPRTRGEWTILLVLLVVGAMLVDVFRIHDRNVRGFFRRFFGDMIRRHEQTALMGSTYLLLATLLAVDLFPRPIAAAAVGFTVLGDASAAVVGRAYGKIRFFGKTAEGALAGLVACLIWAAYLAGAGLLDVRVAVFGALVASLVEFLPIPFDDNLGMTLFSGYAMHLLASALS
jgi:dolichol kinase